MSLNFHFTQKNCKTISPPFPEFFLAGILFYSFRPASGSSAAVNFFSGTQPLLNAAAALAA